MLIACSKRWYNNKKKANNIINITKIINYKYYLLIVHSSKFKLIVNKTNLKILSLMMILEAINNKWRIYILLLIEYLKCVKISILTGTIG